VVLKHYRMKNLIFEYDDFVPTDKDRELELTNLVKQWANPYLEEIEKQSGTINFFLKAKNENRVHFDGMSEDLKEKLTAAFNSFKAQP